MSHHCNSFGLKNIFKIVKVKLVLLASIILNSFAISFSQSGFPGNYDITGTIRDYTGAYIPGLRLDFEKQFNDRVVWTDINGAFRVTLLAGEYVVTAPELGNDSLKLFIKIARNGPNVSRLDLVVNSSKLCSRWPRMPIVSRAVSPPVPPAARAVRALGTVTVSIKLGGDGLVKSASAISGHPLLRAAAAQAARQFEYDPDSINDETDMTLSFVFLDGSLTRDGIERFHCDSRIVINSEPIFIEQS